MNGSVSAIDSKINELRKQLQSVEGKETEVYSRIVGYYRSVRNWNKGKKSEYKQRNPFVVREESTGSGHLTPEIPVPVATISAAPIHDLGLPLMDDSVSALYFFRTTCPNCPPVKEYLGGLTVSVKAVNVDTQEGLAEAIAHQILAAPTVLVLDVNGLEIYRTSSVDGLREFFEPRMAVNG